MVRKAIHRGGRDPHLVVVNKDAVGRIGDRPCPRAVDPPPKPPLVRHLTDAEWRRRAAGTLYHSEMRMRSWGWPDPALVYDEERDLFRYRDGRFAFSREWADWRLLRKRKHRGMNEGWGPGGPSRLTPRAPTAPGTRAG